MEAGWIYVLVNSSIPGLAKVGRTTRPPADRAAELSAATGVATPFVVAFDQPVADSCAAERAVHAELDRRGFRVAPNREFFRGPPSEIVRVVLDAADLGGHATPSTARRSAADLLALGDRCLHGLGETLQDTAEALRLYKLAAARGALAAFERLGQVYGRQHDEHPDRASWRRALSPLKEGARRGNQYCYAEMALLFAREGHLANTFKAWDLFFDRYERADADTRADRLRFAAACCRYVATCLQFGRQPAHRHELAGVAPAMLAALLAELDRLGGDPAGRHPVVAVLRWAYMAFPLAAARLQAPRPKTDTPPAWLPQPEVAAA